MPLWRCDFQLCQRPAVRTLGECILCNRHLCSKHSGSQFHTCPKWEVGSPQAPEHPVTDEKADEFYDCTHSQNEEAYDPAAGEATRLELTDLLRRINTDALASRATKLRDGVPCSVPQLQYEQANRSSVMGGMNYHVDITFDDGVWWIARIRRSNATSPPPALRDYILLSEVATLRFLEKTAVPSPRLFDHALESDDNPVGVGYILMEKLPGRSLRWSVTPEQRERVLRGLADVLIELQRHPFDRMGSLDLPGQPHVGPFAREGLTDFRGSEMVPMGPCDSLDECRTREIKLTLDLILRDEMYSDRPVDAYLIHRFLLDLVPAVSPPPADRTRPSFYLKHADDKGDHILVDEDFNVTGIIDWEWAHTAPPAVAFNSPIAFLPVGDFYDGRNELGEDEVVLARIFERKGRADLAAFVRNGRLQHRFHFCCGYDLADWKGFVGLFRGLRDAVRVDEGLEWDAWKGIALERYKEDAGLGELLARQDEVEK